MKYWRTFRHLYNFESTMPEILSAKRRGALIVFEGCDHSGKTTQCSKLISALEKNGDSVKLLKYPDRTTAIGLMINSYLKSSCEIEDHSVHLLFSANRWESVPEIMRLLESGTTLIVDRYAYSGVAFTAAKKGFSMEWCKQADVGLPKPDAVFYLSLDPEAAAKRGTFGDERYEKKDFQQKVKENFEELKEDNWMVINADKPIADLHEDLLTQVKDIMLNAQNKPIGKLWTKESC